MAWKRVLKGKRDKTESLANIFPCVRIRGDARRTVFQFNRNAAEFFSERRVRLYVDEEMKRIGFCKPEPKPLDLACCYILTAPSPSSKELRFSSQEIAGYFWQHKEYFGHYRLITEADFLTATYPDDLLGVVTERIIHLRTIDGERT